MADWGQPTIDSLKVDVLDVLKLRDIDSITLAEGPTNPPVGAKRWNYTTKTFQEWAGTAWTDLVISLAGGGTGTGSGQAFGTMAYQNSNNVAITGGTIVGLSNFGVVGNAYFNGLIYAGPSNAVQLTNSAGFIREEAIADGTIYARNAANEIITGAWTFNNIVKIGMPSPVLDFNETDGPVDAKFWRIVVDAGTFHLQGLNDALSSSLNYIHISRAGLSASSINLNTATNISGITTVNNAFRILNATNAGIIAGLTTGLQIVAGNIGSSISSKICFGDGSGWQLQFCSVDAGGDSQTKITFTDQGVIQTAGNIAMAPTGAAGTRLTIAAGSQSSAPIALTSGEPGVNGNWVTLGNNYSHSVRFNTAIGGSFIRLRDGGISLHTVSNTGVVRSGIDFRINEVATFGYQYYFYDINGAEYQGRIYGETPGAKLTITGNTWATFACADGAQGIQARNNQKLHVFNTNICPISDNGLYCGDPSFKWHTVWAFTGTIATSDMRMKKHHGIISRASEIIQSIEPAIYSFPAMKLDTGEDMPEFFFPGLTAQEVDSKIDKKLGTQIVNKTNPEAWGMNYSYLIPILWAAVRELLEERDSQ